LNERRTIDINVDVNVDIKTEEVIQNMLPRTSNTSSSSSYNTSFTNAQQTSTSFSITRRDDSSIKLPIICNNAQQQKGYSSEISYATNFTNTIHDILIQYFMSSSRTIVDLPLQFFEFQWQNDNLTSSEDTNGNNMSTNYGGLDLIKSLITAENEQHINNALAYDFTTADTANLSRGKSAGIGCGLQLYLKGKLVLTAGGGGGGGRSYTSSSEEGYECGGGGGASIFLPDSDNTMARVGGGHGMQAGYETGHNPKLFVEQLQRLKYLLINESKSNVNDIAILGGGGGGSGCTNDNTSSSNGRGYGFGFEIGSIEGINLAKKEMMSRRSNNEASGTGSDDNRNPLNLPEHLLNEEWAIQVAEYI